MKQNFKIFMTISIFLCLFAFTGCGSVGVAIVDTDGQKNFYEDSLEKGTVYISGSEYTIPGNDFIYIVGDTDLKDISIYKRKIQAESNLDIDINIDLYENASFTGGSQNLVFNKNRNLEVNNTFNIYSTPATVDLSNAYLLPFSNRLKGDKKVIAETSEFADYIMKQNTTYVLKITNNNPQTATLYFTWNWLELTE